MKKFFLFPFFLVLFFSFNEKAETQGQEPVRPYPGNISKKADCLIHFRDDPVLKNECIALYEREQEPVNPIPDSRVTCFKDMKGGIVDGIGEDYKHKQEQSEQLLKTAEERYETLKNCRGELRKVWIDFQQRRGEQIKERNSLPIKIRQAEIAYREELNRIQRECREKANEDFANYRKLIVEKGNVGPHQLHGMTDQINSHRNHFYKNCYQSPENVQAMEIAKQKLTLNQDAIRVEMKTVNDLLKEASDQTSEIQDDILKGCEEKEKLIAYNEQMASHINSEAMRHSKYRKISRFTDSLMSCMGSGAFSNPLRSTGSSTTTK